MTGYIPVPPEPWVPTATDSVTKRLPDATMEAIAESQEISDAIAAQGGGGGVATPDATSSVKGKLRLTGDLGGTADSPTVPGLAGKAPIAHTHPQSDVTGLTSALSGKADLVGGVIPTAQLPAIAISEFLGSVNSQAAMLALGGQKGDWATRSDTSETWIISGNTPTDIGSWTKIVAPAGGGGGAVASVNGQAGVVVLAAADVGAATPAYVDGRTQDASSTAKGVVELATDAETLTGTDAVRAVTPASLAAKLLDAITTQAVIVVTGSEARPAGADVVIWVNPDALAIANDGPNDIIVSPGEATNIAALVDAKGDILAGSAADTLVRLPVGANGKVLKADSTQASGLIWADDNAGGGGSAIGATPVLKIKSGNWFGSFDIGGTGAFASGTLNRLDLAPLWISQSTPVNRIAIRVSAAGGAGALTRLGIFNAKADGMPGTVLLDAGTVDCTSNGVKEIVITQTLAPGLYYTGAVNQVATSQTYAHKGMDRNRYGADWDEGYFASEPASMMNFLTVSGVSGALADLSAASFTHRAGDVIKVGLRAA